MKEYETSDSASNDDGEDENEGTDKNAGVAGNTENSFANPSRKNRTDEECSTCCEDKLLMVPFN